jgi:hypothetical protein
MQIITFLNEEKIEWEIKGDLSKHLTGHTISRKALNLFSILGGDGWKVVSVDQSYIWKAKSAIASILHSMSGGTVCFDNYEEKVDDQLHLNIIQRTRDLRSKDLGLDLVSIAEFFSDQIKLPLSPILNKLGREHLQVRIVRPNAMDFNPPHRDSYLDYYQDVLNLWMPIVCEPAAVMPVCSGSHLWADSKVTRTAPGDAIIGSSKYTVPAVVAYEDNPLRMVRPKLVAYDAIAFTPYLIHGFGVNTSESTRFALEVRLQLC